MKTCPACLHQNKESDRICTACEYGFDSTLGSDETVFAPQVGKGIAADTLISGRYQVMRELGRGGMGVVYLVKDAQLRDRELALKMVHPNLVQHEEARRRFEDEVALSLDLHHPNIIRVHHLEAGGESLYFTMEYVEGRSIRELLDERKKANKPFSLAESLVIITPLLDALSYAHKYTIHRDIKPENIIITGEFPKIGVKILDFGIAKTLSSSRFTQTAQAMGTAYYMAPEQMAGAKHIDQRADLYSVGMILYELLTLKMAVGRWRLPSELAVGLSPAVDRVLEKALKAEPENRFGSAEEMRSQLDGVVASLEEEKARKKEQEAEEKRQADEREKEAAEERRREKEKKERQEAESRRQAEEKRRAEEARKRAEEERRRREEERQREEERNQREEGVRDRNMQEPPPVKQSGSKVSLYVGGGLVVLVLAWLVLFSGRQEPPPLPASPPETSSLSVAPSPAVSPPAPEKVPEQAPMPGRLYVETEPANATVRILDSKHRFKQGMELAAGSYELEVSATGYGKWSGGVEMSAGKTVRLSRQLAKDEAPVVASSAPPAPVQSQAVQPVAAPISGQGAVSGIELVTMPGGCYQMGDTFGDGSSDEKPVHEVCVDAFKIGKYEVTQGQWESVMGSNPSLFKKGSNYPVEQVSWNDAQQFIQKLNAKSGKRFRLPTEAEWEYAARSGGKSEKYSGGNDIDRVAWYSSNSGSSSHPVGTKSPNGLGIYDMSGNVDEWCQDLYGNYSSSPRNNPQGPSSAGTDKVVIRGGSWNDAPKYVRSADRNEGRPMGRYGLNLGFRLVLPVQ